MTSTPPDGPGPDDTPSGEWIPDAEQAPTIEGTADTPPGYPEGFTGGAEPTGGFIAATEPKKSKLWVLWVVIGAVLIGVVILAAVLIPVLIAMFGSVGSQGPDPADEQAAVQAVKDWDTAWREGDCDLYMSSTTENFRANYGIVDCAQFDIDSQQFNDALDDYQQTVGAVEGDRETLTIDTVETYTSIFDADGNQLEAPVAYEDNWEYVVIRTESGWAIDAVQVE